MAIKQWLQNGGIAVALTVAGIETGDRLIETPAEREIKFATAVSIADSSRRMKIVKEEMRVRKVGEEIVSLRAPHSRTTKEDGKYRTIVSPKQLFYPDGDSLMAIDTRVHETEAPNLIEQAIGKVKGALGMDVPEPTHDRYVYAGAYNATWFADNAGDYTLTATDGNESIQYTALHDLNNIAVTNEPTDDGVKQTLVLNAPVKDSRLRWRVDSTSPLIHRGNGIVTSGNLVLSAPVAWDASGDTVNVAVSVSGDTLTYALFDSGKMYPVTVDPTTTVSGNVQNGYIYKNTSGPTYTVVTGNRMAVGYSALYAPSQIYRSFACFPNIPEIAEIDSANYVMRVTENYFWGGAGDWSFVMGDARGYKSVLGGADPAPYNDYLTAASPTYTAHYGDENISDYPAGATYRIGLSTAGLDTLEAIGARSDSLWWGARANGELESGGYFAALLFFDGGNSSTPPYLEIFYTVYLNTPTDFVLSNATATSFTATYAPNCSADIDSATIVSNAGAWMGRFSPNNATSKTLTGLTPNTQYIAKARIDSSGQTVYSNLDTLRTLAAVPVWNFLEDYTDSTHIRIGFGTNSNPAGTMYAIRDSVSQKWVASNGAPDSTYKVWQTAADWATTEFITGCDPSERQIIGILARNDDGVETAYAWGNLAIGNVKRIEIAASTAMMTQSVTATSYAVARADTSSGVVSSSTTLAVGQTNATGVWGIFRTHLEFPLISYMDSVLADTLMVTGANDVSTDNFRVYCRPGLWDLSYPYYMWHSMFAGARRDSAGTHIGQNLFQNWSSSSYAATMKWAFADTGNTYINGKIGDIVRFTITSDADSAYTAPTGGNAQDIIISNPKLILSYIWMDKAPNNIVATAISSDSIVVSFSDRSYSETGYALIDAYTGLRMGGADSVGADVQEIRYGGLLPNTTYNFKVMVLGGKMAGGVSTHWDAARTWAAVPDPPTVTVLATLTHRKIVIDTAGLSNPGTTLYALQDSITGKYVRPYAGALDSMVSGTYDSSWVWQTFSQWGGANGDTIYFPAGNRSAFRIYSKNSQ